MDFLRLYLGEITGLALVVLTLFVAAAFAMRYLADRSKVRLIRNLCIAAAVAAFAASLTFCLVVNQTPRGRVDRTAADQDQKAFERRHSGEAK